MSIDNRMIRFVLVTRLHSSTCIVLVYWYYAFAATINLNQWFQPGDQAFIIVASAMVLIMIPGLAFLYSGLARRKSALSVIWAVLMSASVITFQWYFWGYSLAFSRSATNGFIGNMENFGLQETLGRPSQGSPLIPDLLYSFYQVCHHFIQLLCSL